MMLVLVVYVRGGTVVVVVVVVGLVGVVAVPCELVNKDNRRHCQTRM